MYDMICDIKFNCIVSIRNVNFVDVHSFKLCLDAIIRNSYKFN